MAVSLYCVNGSRDPEMAQRIQYITKGVGNGPRNPGLLATCSFPAPALNTHTMFEVKLCREYYHSLRYGMEELLE